MVAELLATPAVAPWKRRKARFRTARVWLHTHTHTLWQRPLSSSMSTHFCLSFLTICLPKIATPVWVLTCQNNESSQTLQSCIFSRKSLQALLAVYWLKRKIQMSKLTCTVRFHLGLLHTSPGSNTPWTRSILDLRIWSFNISALS